MNRRPKIKDIAEALGVSSATVSRALSGSALVTDETRARVR
ncbi:LacI family DNA-binding transcriptional regulator, partial [uncultured Nitratireductor sp.]